GVMPLMPGDDVEQRPYTHFLAARYAASRQHGLVRMPHELDRRGAYDLQLFQQVTERPAPEIAGRHIRVLIEAGERRGIAAADAQRPIGEDALGIDHMSNDILRRPLAG